MKKVKLMFISILLIVFIGCVQKTRKTTVVYTLKIQDNNDVKSVGIRGNNDPLNWDNDFEMKVLLPDSIYQAIVTYNTGYKFTEIKFTKNGEFEFQNSPNRKVIFSDSDTTRYQATFNSFE